jgi:hypothetical protein
VDVGIHRATVVEEFVEGCLERIGEDDLEEEHPFRDLWEDENQTERLKNRRDRKRGGQHGGKDVHQEGFRQGQEGSLVSLPGVRDQGRSIRWILREAEGKKSDAEKLRSILRPTFLG